MGVSVTWDNEEHTIFRYDIVDPWTWEDFLHALKEDDAMLEDATHTLHLILNAQDVRAVPPNPVARFRSLASGIHVNLGLIIVVGDNIWLQKLAELFYRVYGQRADGLLEMHMASSLEDARKMIAAHQNHV